MYKYSNDKWKVPKSLLLTVHRTLCLQINIYPLVFLTAHKFIRTSIITYLGYPSAFRGTLDQSLNSEMAGRTLCAGCTKITNNTTSDKSTFDLC